MAQEAIQSIHRYTEPGTSKILASFKYKDKIRLIASEEPDKLYLLTVQPTQNKEPFAIDITPEVTLHEET